MRVSSFAFAACVTASALTLGVSPEGSPGIGSEAHATTAVLISLDEMLKSSDQVVVAQPLERFSQWEEIGQSRRIVTYTRLTIEELVVGSAKQDIWVRTLGGTSPSGDKIGQHVAGEAEFTIGEPSLVFLTRRADNFVVTAMAQGHYPVESSGGVRKLKSSPNTGTLLRSKKAQGRSAREDLVGETLERATQKIQAAKAASK